MTAPLFNRLPVGVRSLIVANGAVFLMQGFLPSKFLEFMALTPVMVWTRFYVWQVFTYSFLHVEFWHFFINMFSLWMFGAMVENYWGTKTFLRYYFLCVLGAAACQAFMAPSTTVMGASGGIYGLLLAMGFLFPDSTLYLFFFFPFRAIQAVFIIGLMTFLSSLNAGGSRVAHMAHLGGMLTGFLYFKLPQWLAGWRKPRFHVVMPEPKSEKEELTEKVDRILEKISVRGVDSLTPEEHAIMKKYSEKI